MKIKIIQTYIGTKTIIVEAPNKDYAWERLYKNCYDVELSEAEEYIDNIDYELYPVEDKNENSSSS